jgi:hypothetical protein
MRRFLGLFVWATSWSIAGSCFAQADSATEEGWRFTVTPYFLAAGLDGKTGVNGVTTDVDVPFSDIFDKLDAGFMMFATARKGRWFGGFDAMYFKLSDAPSNQVTGPFGKVTVQGALDITVTQQFYDGVVGYRAVEKSATNRVILDVYASARYTSMETEATLTTSSTIPSFPGGSRSMDDEVTWWDPIIGARTLIPFAGDFDLNMLADFGGFGVGCDVTYQWLLAVEWQFSKPVAISAGYRYFKQDYDQDGFVWDMAMSGFVTGVGISF